MKSNNNILQQIAIPPIINYQTIEYKYTYRMSLIEIDSKTKVLVGKGKNKLTWQEKFRRNVYRLNYANAIHNKVQNEDPILEDKKSQGAVSIISLIKDNKAMTPYLIKRQFYDPQNMQNYYSPYSIFIPLQDQSYLKDQANNTFPYLGHLIDTGKRAQSQKYYQQISQFFKDGKRNGTQFVQQQWKKAKLKYICQLDSVKALSLLIELTKKNSSIIDQLYRKYSPNCCKQIFFHRITRTSMYMRSTLRMRKNLKVSIQVGAQINEKTLPETMKTWYCALCVCYDCEKHKLQQKAEDFQYQYISQKNKKSNVQHIQNTIKLLRFHEQLKSDNRMQQQKPVIDYCSNQCYMKLKASDIFRLSTNRHKLISPLAKALLKLGLQMFSYNPCLINRLFQSRSQKNSISCALVYIHFTEQCNLTSLIQTKMNNTEYQYLKKQNNKRIDIENKIQSNPPKVKRTTYLQKRNQYQNPQFALCLHNFVDQQAIDPRCTECCCRQRGFCLPTCLCTSACEIQRIACVCKGSDTCQTEKCLCFTNKLECQPGVCGDCFEGKQQKKKNNCCNDQILRGKYRKIAIGISHIPGAGLGAFAGEKYKKNDLVIKYSGQHINSDIDQIRQAMIKDLSFYNFDSPNGKVILASIDARFMGNKARFINHGNTDQANLRAQTLFSNGTEYIALFAAKDIMEGQQLKFNYDGKGVLYTQHRDKYPFIKPPKKKD